jgi:hypothetical protein
MAFILGFKGNEWAWKNKKWESIEEFKRVQKLWIKWALISYGIFIIFMIIFFTIVWRTTAGPVDVANEFFKDTSEKNADAAYLLLAPGVLTRNEFLNMMKDYPQLSEVKSVTFSDRSITGTEAVIKGEAIMVNGSEYPISVNEMKISNTWKITEVYGLTNLKQKATDQGNIINNTRPETIGNFKFPVASYKDFSLTSDSDSLNPKIAAPNVTEYGSPHLEVTKDMDGYSATNLPLLGIALNIPFGWGSKGGFDTMERVDFFPAPTEKDLKSAFDDGTSIDLGIKVLDSSGIGATDFKGVMAKVEEMMKGKEKKQSFTKEVDEKNHIFIIKNETIDNLNLLKPSSSYSIYIQSPIDGSTVWVDIDIRAPKDQFQKYLGLLGLVYKDMNIDWEGLDSYMLDKNK